MSGSVTPLGPRPVQPGAPMVTLTALPERPCISVIIPSYNQGAFIHETIASALDQDYRPIEIIVVDGASTDGTLDVLRSYDEIEEVRWLSEPDSGVAEAVNKGFALARGEILAIQSSDDFYLPGAFRTVSELYLSRPETGLMFGDVIKIDADGQELHATAHEPYSLEGFLRKSFYIPQPTAFFRRELIEELGGWDPRYFNADAELWLRMVFRTKVQKIDTVLGKYRLHDDQRENQASVIVADYKRMIVESPDIAAQPRRLQRLAQSGAYLTSMRYNPSGSYFYASLDLWRAFFCDPSRIRDWLGSAYLLPGYLSLKVLGAKVKQWAKRQIA